MRFEEAQQSGEKSVLAGPQPQLVSPDSGQVDEPLRPTRVTKRCRKCGESENHRIIVVRGLHSLRGLPKVVRIIWRRS